MTQMRWACAVAGLHGPDDLLDRGHIGAIAGEQLVAQRHPLAGDDQGHADLLAVRPVIAAVAALGQRIVRAPAFEVRAGHVVEEQIVVEREELAERADQMLLQRRLVRAAGDPARDSSGRR